MLEISRISKTFNAGTPNEVRALSDVSLRLAPSSFLIVIGTNGSGKSTLLNAVAGTFLVDVGSISIAGQTITNWPEHRRAKLIGRVFQDPFKGTAPTMSIAENLVLASRRGRARGLSIAVNRGVKAELRDRIRSLNMGLEDRLDNPIGRLSGGQRQALTLLMASWVRPELLLLDEHIEREKLTTLMVTHSMQQAVNLGDRIVMMHKGRILHDLQESERARVRPEDLLRRFEDIRRREQLDGAVAAMLADAYV
jgi:putative tryptophan/tyrosine transport system ATP-binding protein